MLAVLAFVLAPLAAFSQTTDENQLLLMARSAELNCQGAPGSARTRAATQYLVEILKAPVEIPSAVVTGFDCAYLSGVGRVDVCGGAALEETKRLEMWGVSRAEQVAIFQRCLEDNGGHLIKAESCRVKYVRENYETPCREAFQIKKSYQDREITYSILINQNDPVFSNLRIGQKVTATVMLLGLQRTSATATLVRLTPETKVLRCPNGHEYAPSAGYKFCPIDGLPLK